MSKSLVVRYRTKPECAEENARLIRDVFAELAQSRPEGLSYHAYRLADGVSFVHAVTLTTAVNPLTSSAAFAAFQAGIAERCEEGPTPTDATEVGSYR
ncbi:hypothetical protein SAMN05444157_1687 [Frankineae bacterium MT45]|nr:hypothetical protein SAMN05444157_1687 [Frankineae bacterium MT45]